MTEVEVKKAQESLQDRLAQVVELLQRQRVVEDLTHRQEGAHNDLVENLVHRQNLVELQRKLDDLHPADIAYILEALPLEDRLTVWQLVQARIAMATSCLKFPTRFARSSIADMDDHELLAAAKEMDADELAGPGPRAAARRCPRADGNPRRPATRACALGAELRRGAGRCADGLRDGHHPRRRQPGSGAALCYAA